MLLTILLTRKFKNTQYQIVKITKIEKIKVFLIKPFSKGMVFLFLQKQFT